MGLVEISLGVILCLFGLFFLLNGILSFFSVDYVFGLILGVLAIVGGIKLIKKS
jgi:hypothetical protein